MFKNLIYLFFVIMFTNACVPPTEEVITEVSIDYSDLRTQQFYNLLDKQDIDSILMYTSHPNPGYRFLMGNAFASIKSSEGIDSLAKLLKDDNNKVRYNAAYALGQIGDPEGAPILLSAFINKDTLDVNNASNNKILEAIGKTGDLGLLKSLSTVTSYRNTDTLLLIGQTRAIYRFALRGITTPEGTDLMVEYVTNPDYPNKVQVIAANYLQRASNISIEEYKFRIADAMIAESNMDIKIALASTLKKSTDRELFPTLINELKKASDYRYQVNLLKAISVQTYISAVEPNLEHLNNENLHVAKTAADFLINKGNRGDAIIYRNFLTDNLHWEVQAKVYASILKLLPNYYARTKVILKNEILKKIEASANDYEKAGYLEALSFNPQNYSIIKDLGFSGSPILKTAAMSGLNKIINSEDFNTTFRGSGNRVREEILGYIKEAIQLGDPGMIAVAGNILKTKENGLYSIIENPSFLVDALSKLELPKDIETYNELSEAIATIKGEAFTPKKVAYNHPIDWSEVNSFSDSSVVNIRTNKGLIKAKLFIKEAPGTVSNFTSLSKSGFYNDKAFHRVVPNFVIQTGCPRGDGYGGLNYTIRSELPSLYYDGEGYIGMASSGNHTEGTQWFITHSPTPHLDGNYTIFGKVISGMDVVHSIQVGDRIEDIIITK